MNRNTDLPTQFSFPRLRSYLWVFLLLLAFTAGILFKHWYYRQSEVVLREQADVLLEHIQQVAKLISVEGYFTEIYDHKEYYGFDLPFFRKKALIKVKAKVSVGYDLEKLKVTALPEQKILRISNLPEAEILSIEHDLDYYDLQEGVFNAFSTDDYNRLNAHTKNFIRKKALESNLMKQANQQLETMFETVRFVAENMGWKIEIEKNKWQPEPNIFPN